MAQKRKRSPETDNAPAPIFRSSAIEDRSSRFMAAYSPSLKPKDLQNHPEFASASHRMLGWRRESNQQAITGKTHYVTGSDDDGEKYGGKRVEKVLEALQVTGSCVVARWYGGVMLGPVRFTHIEEVARGAVGAWREAMEEERVEKRKKQEDEREVVRLVKVLGERDESIVVLRALVADKERKLKVAKVGAGEESSEVRSTVASPAKTPTNCDSFPVEKLRLLEKARDATLSFLLKRIDKAEQELAALDVT